MTGRALSSHTHLVRTLTHSIFMRDLIAGSFRTHNYTPLPSRFRTLTSHCNSFFVNGNKVDRRIDRLMDRCLLALPTRYQNDECVSQRRKLVAEALFGSCSKTGLTCPPFPSHSSLPPVVWNLHSSLLERCWRCLGWVPGCCFHNRMCVTSSNLCASSQPAHALDTEVSL